MYPKDFENKIICGDCLEVMKEIPDKSIDLIVTDPPYFTQQIRKNENLPGSYSDKWNSLDEFVEYISERVRECYCTLKKGGSLYVMQDSNAVHYIKVELDKIFGKANFQREIIWRIGWISGYKTQGKFPRNHDTILFYGKGTAKTFHIQRGWNDNHLAKYYPKKQESIVDDVWIDIDSEKIMTFKHTVLPTQKSLELFERMVKASSNEGDTVLDPFAGSGTLGKVCQNLNRNFILIDNNPEAVQIAEKRLAEK